MSQPAFSVIVRTCNRPEFLPRCLESIARQECRDFEVVLVNDGGPPVHPAAPFPLTCVQHDKRRGRPYALNSGLRAARGRYLAFLDDDDRYLPHHLSTLAEVLSDAAPAAYTDVYSVGKDGRRELTWNRDFWQPLLYWENWIPICALGVSRAVAEEVGEVDERLLAFEDWDYLIRLSERVRFRHVPVPTAEVYFHGGNIMGTDLRRYYRMIMEKHQAARRRQLLPWRLPVNAYFYLSQRLAGHRKKEKDRSSAK
ncbi:MAG: glycosyltransferase family 2 protein [Chitinophagales bacterium]